MKMRYKTEKDKTR